VTLAAGTKLGPYEVLSPLGAGGMGEVYRARDARLGREVAIKVLPERLVEDPDALSRFEREAKSVAALSHPNILALHDVGREGRVAYAVMELLEGETLREALSAGPLLPRRAIDYAVQVALGLAAAHEKGIVHRDLKPDNVFVTRDERVKVLDFGLAKPGAALASTNETESPTVSGYTEPGKVMGTVGYMSPEQVRGLPVDHRSDIFSFGSMLYEMLAGRRAFQRETAAETMTAILREEPPELSETSGPVFASLAPVLHHCLEKKPERRFQSARDLAFALGTASAPSTATPALSAPLQVVPAPPRRFAWIRILSVLAAVAAAAAAGYLLHPSSAVSSGPDGSDLTVTLLTTDPGYEAEPTFSPDGRTIAYVSDRDGNFEIYLQQISGGPAINLTKNAAADIQPAFSPDGREIAFVSNRAGATDVFHAAPGLPLVGGDIWIMPALGGPARKIVEKGNFPSWTPDGSEILYVHGSFRSCKIARVPAAGGESRDIPIEDAFVARYFYPHLSRDGRWLLYQNGNQIEVAPAAGGKGKALGLGMAPAWGFGSASIVYTDDTPGRRGSLRSAPFSASRGELSGPSRPLTLGRVNDLGAVVSPDGTAVAFSALDDSLNLEELPFDAESGRVLGPPRELTAGSNRVGFFDASPDGKAVIFAAERGATSHLWRIDPPEPAVELTNDPNSSENSPEWSPDGRQIAFLRAHTALRENAAESSLWLMRPDGTNPRRVVDSSGSMIWLPDGRALIQRGDSLERRDLATGASEPVPGPNVRTLLAVDQAGRWLAYQTFSNGAMTLMGVPVIGGTPRPISTAPYEAYHPFFSPSGRWLYFQPGHKNLYRVPGPTQDWKIAPPEKVTDFSGLDLYIEDPRICRDGTKLFYTRGRRTGDIVILRFPKSGERKETSP
jgi:serine/threonine protein kinase/Tol biopolymer transport system component